MENTTILLVDDEPTNVQVLFAALRNKGRVQFATSGEKALALAKDTPPDVVFLDMNMPNMSGVEFCKHLKADPVTKEAVVIFVSGDGDEDQVCAALNAGAFDFMIKPAAPSLIQRRLEIALLCNAQKPQASAARSRVALIKEGPKNILLVEDGKINRMIIGEILSQAGHSVETAATGAKALEKLGADLFDCVLLDIHLPDMTGLKVIKYLRQLDTTNAQAQVVAVTGDVTVESLADYLDAGFDNVVPKPIEPERLLAVISGQDVDAIEFLQSAPELGGPDLLIAADRMAMLKATYPEDRLKELFVLFKSEVKEYIVKLHEAAEAKDEQQIMEVAHRLKSALGHFACAKMHNVAQLLSREEHLHFTEKERLIIILDEQFEPTLTALSGALDLRR